MHQLMQRPDRSAAASQMVTDGGIMFGHSDDKARVSQEHQHQGINASSYSLL